MKSKQAIKKQNGNDMEIIAMKILSRKFESLEYVNNLIDFYAENEIPIEIKSCQYKIESGNPKYPKRFGRFKMEKEQHNFLEIHKGFYLFLVHHNKFLVKGKLIEAVDIPFTPQITWRELMERPNFNVELIGGKLNG